MYKVPKLHLIEHNIIRDYFLPEDKQKGVWPIPVKTMNQALDSVVQKKYSLKSLKVYVPYQRYFSWPNPTYGSFFRIQSYLWVYWFQFNLDQFCIQLDLGSKQKRIVLETHLWLRKTKTSTTSIWPYFQRASSFDTPPSFSFIQWNSNVSPLYFTKKSLLSPVFWFEENLPNIRLAGWNYYSRLHSQSLDTMLSQSIFDDRVLQRRSPWSSSTLWLTSPIHDYGVFISDLISTDSVILSEKYFQYTKRRQRLASYWTQLLAHFWKSCSKSVTWSSISFFFSFTESFHFYTTLRYWFKQGLQLSSVALIFAHKSNLLSFFLPSFFSLFPLFLSTFHWRSKAVPAIHRPSKKSTAGEYKLFLFPQKKLYTQYLQKKAFIYPLWITTSFTVHPPLARLNYFLTVLFQNSFAAHSMKPFQFLLIWFFLFKEMPQSLSALTLSRSLERLEPSRKKRLEIFHGRAQGRKFQGPKSQGRKFQGPKSQGRKFQGPKSQGPKSQGRDFQGRKSQGPKFQGRDSQGRKFQGRDSQGWKSQGRDSQGRKSQGPKFQGRDFQGRNFQGLDSQGRKFQGPKFQGRKFQGTKSQGRNFQGPKSQDRDFQGRVQGQGWKSQGRDFQRRNSRSEK